MVQSDEEVAARRFVQTATETARAAEALATEIATRRNYVRRFFALALRLGECRCFLHSANLIVPFCDYGHFPACSFEFATLTDNWSPPPPLPTPSAFARELCR